MRFAATKSIYLHATKIIYVCLLYIENASFTNFLFLISHNLFEFDFFMA